MIQNVRELYLCTKQVQNLLVLTMSTQTASHRLNSRSVMKGIFELITVASLSR